VGAVVLLEVVLTAGTRLAPWVRALESLDASVDALVALEVAASGETTLADGANMRLGLALGRPSRAVLALCGRGRGWALGGGAVGSVRRGNGSWGLLGVVAAVCVGWRHAELMGGSTDGLTVVGHWRAMGRKGAREGGSWSQERSSCRSEWACV
jgi:hypothetical protein